MVKDGKVGWMSTKANIEPIELVALIAPEMKSRGFKKTKRTWRLEGAENVLLFNIEKSPWGGYGIYMNGGVFIPNVKVPETAPVLHKCHLYGRVIDMLPRGSRALIVGHKAEKNTLLPLEDLEQLASGLEPVINFG